MPKEQVSISTFEGIVGITDPHDVPSGKAFYAENIDMANRHAAFVGLPEDTAAGGSTAAGSISRAFGQQGRFAVVNGSTVSAFSWDGANISAALVSSSGHGTTGSLRSIASDADSVHIGMGGGASSPALWLGQYNHVQDTQLNTMTLGSWGVEEAQLKNSFVGLPDVDYMTLGLPHIVQEEDSTDTNAARFAYSADNTNLVLPFGKYVYYASVIYDGHQPSPLKEIMRLTVGKNNVYRYGTESTAGTEWLNNATKAVTRTEWTLSGDYAWGTDLYENWMFYSGATPYKVYSVDLGLPNPGQFPQFMKNPVGGLKWISFRLRLRTASSRGADTLPKRATRITIWRGSEQSIGGETAITEPRFVTSIDLTEDLAWTSTAGSASTPFDHTQDTYHWFTVTDDKLSVLEFEKETGIASTIEHMNIGYGVSTVVGGYHVVGRAWTPDLNNISTWLFRSKLGRYDTFDWEQDFLVLPSQPIALETSNNRVFAFADNVTYVIDPNIWDIVETWNGIGAYGQASIVSNERGMFWGDASNIYYYDTARVNVIGAPVLHLHNVQGTPRDNGWLTHSGGSTPVACFVPQLNSFLLVYSSGGSSVTGLMYHLDKRGWVVVTGLGAGQNAAHAHMNTTGDLLFFSATGQGYTLFSKKAAAGVHNRRTWRFVSPQYGRIGGKTALYEAYMSLMNLPTDIDASVALPAASSWLKLYADDPDYKDDPITCSALAEGDLYAGNSALIRKALRTTEGGAYKKVRDWAIEMLGVSEAPTSSTGHVVADLTVIKREISER